ncbi:thermostable hemolysin [Pseudoalteromonas lipolytica]|uniref:Thermostable hemolysin n=1 Tax=Pseudoalteromonas lipolytica TaxID=570156 RepID=A0ABY1GDI4_9GAMM|nr:thermostable hemolysin [Pseudoalteromonas lipolytica]MBE0352636.1 hypothetical protein [Pseudoalteromonas lipolytica LMEB 39]SFT38649.1 Thermostable hemolysin [Pseudoalteromonas lipolytica]
MLSVKHSQYTQVNDPTFVCVREGGHDRDRLENTIKQGFAAAYNAKITQFMPLLCELNIDGEVCTLGLRSASYPLFIEQYLPAPIDHFVNAKREQIFELGNLCSTHRKATLAHFVLMNEALYQAGASHLVFCATRKVRALLKMLGVHCNEIGVANAYALQDPASWGSYYDNQPTLCVVDLNEAHQCIINTPALFNIKQQCLLSSLELAVFLEAL